MELALRHEVFRFKHKRPSTDQTSETCVRLASSFVSFVYGSKGEEVGGDPYLRRAAPGVVPQTPWSSPPVPKFSTGEIDELRRACECAVTWLKAQKTGDARVHEWLPAYGCALVVTLLGVSRAQLTVVYPDGWVSTVHSLPSGECVHSAVATTYRELSCGVLDPRQLKAFDAAFKDEKVEAQKRTGRARHATMGEDIGHQKTPAFVVSLAKKALARTAKSTSRNVVATEAFAAFGGTTDVGLHTGGQARDTCWPVVCAVLQRCLRDGGALWRKALTAFQLHLLQQAIADVSEQVREQQPSKLDYELHARVAQLCDKVDDLFAMFVSVSCLGASLIDAGHDGSQLAKTCAQVRSDIDGLARWAGECLDTAYTLPNSNCVKEWSESETTVTLCEPTMPNPSNASNTLHPMTNLGYGTFVSAVNCNFQSLNAWIDATRAASVPYSSIVVLRSVERFMIRASQKLLDTTQADNQAWTPNEYLDNGDIEDMSPEELKTLVEKYTTCVKEYNAQEKSNAHLLVEQTSLDLLVKWIAFCLAHQWCCEDFSYLDQFKIALDWKHLGVAVLSDRRAVWALQNVAQYIRSFSKAAPKASVFNLHDQEGTLEFARKYAATDEDILRNFSIETEAWQQYVVKMWGSIEKKKRQAESLRADIVRQEAVVAKCIEEREEAKESVIDNPTWQTRERSRETKAALQQSRRSLENLQNQLATALKMPPRLVKPLPSHKAEALTVLFFLKMPPDLQILGELCVGAQLALCPDKPTREMLVPSGFSSVKAWAEHYNLYKQASIGELTTTFLLTSAIGNIPKSVGPSTIDVVPSLKGYESQCVWAPSLGSAASFQWKDASGRTIDPFQAPEQAMREKFTEKLPAPFTSWQWMNNYPGGDSRGNLVYAKLGELNIASQSPDYDAIEDSAIVTLATLRAFPNQQLRRILCALAENALPWDHPCVQVIVRQALYQVGELTDCDRPELRWKTDLLVAADGMETFDSVLQDLASKIEQTPRVFEHIPLLSEIAGFASQYTQHGQAIVARFRNVARCRAEQFLLVNDDDEDSANQSTKTTSLIAERRARACLLYGYAVIGFVSAGKLASREMMRELIELVVLFRTNLLFSQRASKKLYEKVLKLQRVVYDVMARHIGYIESVPLISSDFTFLLSKVIGSSDELSWSFYSPKSKSEVTARHFAKNGDTTYAINVFTGSVLSNGKAPGGLSDEIRGHARYLEMFGDADFEVTSAESSMFRTMSEYDGAHYEFGLSGFELVVREIHEPSCGRREPEEPINPTTCTLQLCSSKWMEKFRLSQYPTRIHALYSHWCWLEQNCVILRSKQASDRQVRYVVTFDRDQDGENTRLARCFRVPTVDKKLSFASIYKRLSTYEELVCADDSVTARLSKFERPEFIHTLKSSASQTVRIEFPRYNLSFKLTTAKSGDLVLASEQYSGYVLRSQQQLGIGFLPRFTHYLVLKHSDATVGDTRAPNIRLILPQGCVQHNSSTGMMQIQVAQTPDAQIPVVCYDEHRQLLTLTAETLSARLQLVAVLASGGSSLPCAVLGMTASEAAIQQLKCCWSSKPYSAFETELLENIGALGYREASLKILAAKLFENASELSFLFEGDSQHTIQTRTSIVDYMDQQDKYGELCQESIGRCPVRYRLPGDLDEAISPTLPTSSGQAVTRQHGDTEFIEIMLPLPPVPSMFVRDTERELASYVCAVASNTPESVPEFPLRSGGSNALGTELNRDLEKSWVVYHSQQKRQLIQCMSMPIHLHSRLRSTMNSVSVKREEMKDYLNHCYEEATAGFRNQILKQTNVIPERLTREDLLRCAVSKSVVGLLIPTLGYNGQARFQHATQQFMELCILEDKLKRLIAIIQSELCSDSGFQRSEFSTATQGRLIEELLCVRLWDSSKHPYWLAFEFEGQIQIRPEQFIIATHLLQNPGSMCQLNMGRGKTRVILPMLFLHLASRCKDTRSEYSSSSRMGTLSQALANDCEAQDTLDSWTDSSTEWGKATRATILTPLISEMRQFMQRFLVASTAELRFVELPFHRLIELDAQSIQLLMERLERAKTSGDVLLVAPEHRMSLELKLVELNESPTDGDCDLKVLLSEMLENSHYLDVIDESDAVLHHKYHLVYAHGSTADPLDGGPARWEAAQALLKLLSVPGSRVAKSLAGRKSLSLEYESRRGAYDGTRLLPPLHASNARAGKEVNELDLRSALIEDLLDNTPGEYLWLGTFCRQHPALRDALVVALSDASVAMDTVLGSSYLRLLVPFRSQLLAIRGLVAFGVLEHCLEKRYRVDYGIMSGVSKATDLAIPFRAADVPKERAEFSHPDVAIVLTQLGYYHKGLSDQEIRESFTILLGMDESEQKHRYDQWYASVVGSGSHPLTRGNTLRDVRYLSLSDARQFATICDAFRYCMKTIDFFLDKVVFPHQTKQYPQRLGRSAWDLAANKDAIMGFSGTNDNQLLLPLSVKQREPEAPDLLATNGKMVNCIINTTNGIEIITSSHGSDLLSVPTWQAILQYSLGKGAQALIDTGALLAGVATHDAASFVLQRDQSGRWQGVTYYDSRSEQNCWMVLIKATGITVPLSSSHIRERDTFVIFDEARTRGADMKLPATAAAVLTLGPRLTKDKLMQGAGRMRQLGGGSGSGGQTLWFACLNDVAQHIRASACRDIEADAELTAVDVLEWVMANTKDEVTRGLIEWSSSGIQFELAREDSTAEVLTDDWALETLYAPAHSVKTLANIITDKIAAHYPNGARGRELTSVIEKQATKYGLDDVAFVTAHTDECERELQVEEEDEEERETQMKRREPAKETPWDFSQVVGATSVQKLENSVSFTNLGSFFSNSVARGSHLGLRSLALSSLKVFATRNFLYTINVSDESNWTTPVEAERLRIANSFLLFADGSILLLSELEADGVLGVLWDVPKASTAHVPTMINLPFAMATIQNTIQAPPLAMPGRDKAVRIFMSNNPWAYLSVDAVVACALWNGETTFEQRVELKPFDRGANQEEFQDVRIRTALRKLLSRVKSREASMLLFVTDRRQGNRWQSSNLHKFCCRLDWESCARALSD